MKEIIQNPVSVIMVNNPTRGSYPYGFKWANHLYQIQEIGYHHQVNKGRDLHHIYSVTAEDWAFRLDFNASTLEWILEEVNDGEA